ncbi:hypothetical protein DdX_10702 [Ditylenchus destructor]|uniref:Uncharacterized protein n=1 Tax=Ditylenchus destructor TaxID=166010 RepID=A0AAD4R584_9BILA|nr:hypothetical protein DdX_10702 [Ditylenchus destructor]
MELSDNSSRLPMKKTNFPCKILQSPPAISVTSKKRPPEKSVTLTLRPRVQNPNCLAEEISRRRSQSASGPDSFVESRQDVLILPEALSTSSRVLTLPGIWVTAGLGQVKREIMAPPAVDLSCHKSRHCFEI